MSRRILPIVLGALLVSCASILGLHDGELDRRFPHRAHLAQGVACYRCHVGINEANPGLKLHLPGTAECKTCHERPHVERTCSDCHAATDRVGMPEQNRKYLRFEHRAHLKTVNGNCARCHHEIPEDRAVTPAMSTCLGCHEHQDTYDGRVCDQCHKDLPAEAPRPVSHAGHGPDFGQRHGLFAGSQRDYCQTCHGERFCLGCHGVSVPALSAKSQFDRPDRGLNQLHRAGFRARHSDEARAAPGTCTVCHAPQSCNDCHRQQGVGATGKFSLGPHPLGWVGLTSAENAHGRAARADPLSCASCHSGAGEKLCAECHKSGGVGGNIHPPGWRSNKRLTELPCRLCHLGGIR